MSPDRLLLMGSPNVGKSLLFNQLTGLKQKVANFPGATVDVSSGKLGNIDLVDFPGVYCLDPLTKDESVALQHFDKALDDENTSGVLCVMDATRLGRSLYLAMQVLNRAVPRKKPVVFVINMIDELRSNGSTVDFAGLRKIFGAPVLGISAKTGEGLAELKQLIEHPEQLPKPNPIVKIDGMSNKSIRREAHNLAHRYGPKVGVILRNQTKLDNFFLSSFFGGLVFAAIMLFFFQSIFTWSAPLMDLTEELVATLGNFVTASLGASVAGDFFRDAIFGGFGSFLVFVPQIFVLTLIVGLLEDCGYLSRAALICHKPFSLFGLSGKSFIPLLSGHACAIPGIMAARTIDSPKKRLLTIIAMPLMGCSARLPVYSLLVMALVPKVVLIPGVLGLQGLVFFTLYFMGILIAMLVTAFLSKSVYRNESDAPFIVDLPPYRVPALKPILRNSMEQAYSFVAKAGAVILSVTVVVWFLGYFPNGPENLQSSYLGSIGKFLEPIFTPLGLDWKYGVAIITSFLAREVFVGTLGTLFGIDSAEEDIQGLASYIADSGMTLATALALLVFYALAMQCVSTLAVMRKELGSFKVPLAVLVAYSGFAYMLSFATYRLVTYLSL